MSAIIYLITNTTNKKKYVGMTHRTVRERWLEHLGMARRGRCTSYLYNAMRKYGSEAFAITVLEETSLECMCDREKYWIAEMQPEYNMTLGGDGVLRLCEESREKRAAKLRGRPLSEKHKAALSAALQGKHVSPETRAKMSAAAKKRTKEYYERLKESRKRAYEKRNATAK